ncbi:poly(ADP-ribose) polymerase family member 14-related sequence 1 isoform X3 [Engraulis encrasicolus]|uniref:poly(ADP-ribose) polymerase family member 14-related sequence 1 isoform X3 n=1 Tax=Engraulis encrasicolus TaxID=184585 RepID=UPI002FD4E58E
MDEKFSFPVLVEGEWNPALPNLKNKLTIYFQSKKSNGGDCHVQHHVSDGRKAVVWFKTEDVRRSVLTKSRHSLKLGENNLTLTVRLTPVTKAEGEEEGVDLSCSEVADGDEASPRHNCVMPEEKMEVECKEEKEEEEEDKEKEVKKEEEEKEKEVKKEEEEEEKEKEVKKEPPEYSPSVAAVLGNVVGLNQEFLEMLVENVLKGPVPSPFSVETLHEISSAVVTFEKAEDAQRFVDLCPRNGMFRLKNISSRLLEVTTKVRAEDLIEDITSDHLQLYFGREGVLQGEVEMQEEDQTAIISFTESSAVSRVIKRQHVISDHPFKVFPYFESLGTALYGKEKPWKLPDAFTEDIDPLLHKCLQDNPECSTLVDREMATLFSKVDLCIMPARISPLPSLLEQKKMSAKVIRSWRDNASAKFKDMLSKFKCLPLRVPVVAWAECEAAIRDAIQQRALSLVVDQSQGKMTVTGLSESVDSLGDLKVTVEEIIKAVERKVGSREEEVKVAASIYHLLEHAGLGQKIKIEIPELKFRYNKSNQSVAFYGLQEEILLAKAHIFEEMLSLSRSGQLNIEDSVIEFLSGGDQEELNQQLFMSEGVSAALEIHGGVLNLVAKTAETIKAAEGQLQKLLNHRCIEIEDLNILAMSEWNQLVDGLLIAVNQSGRRVSVDTDGTIVVISGFVKEVDAVQKDLQNFVHDNSSVTRTVTGRRIIVKFVREQKGAVWQELIKDDLKIDFQDDSVSLCGPRVRAMECQQAIEDLISSIHHDVLRMAKPGAKKSFKDKETLYVSTAASKWGCLVQLEDEVHAASATASTSADEHKPDFRLQTPDGVDIAVFKADMCSFRADAIVNAANEGLQHDGGLAGALLAAAGPQFQAASNHVISQRGQVATGDVVVTTAGGRLRCEHVIHAVGPRFRRDNSQKSIGLLKRAIKGCLREAESLKVHSIAIPAISSGSFGFPLDVCSETIVGAIKEHCEDMYGDGLLKKIHLVNKDDATVRAMEIAVKKVFGRDLQNKPQSGGQAGMMQNQTQSQGQAQGQRILPTGSSTQSVQTKEGLIITLLKGNIQDTTTDVVVNTVGPGLRLDQGAVSNALFQAAGPELQNLVDQQAAPPANEGAVLFTEGCNLKCKRVFHTVAPQWDGGKGHAQRVLSCIVDDCLNEAERCGLRSLTFPAIGTGNLGFPPVEVARLMLDDVLNFSQKKGSNSVQEVVFTLHPSDARTTQAFTDEFNQKFSIQAAPGHQSRGTADALPDTRKGPFSKVTCPSSGLCRTTVGQVEIEVETGDITKEDADVIVNSTNDTFNLNSGVSKAILTAAGPNVIAECQQHGNKPGATMIMTQPGNLKCKKILHLKGQTQPNLIQKSVSDALLLCIQNNMKSVSFPALGTGQGNVAAGVVADAMLDAVIDVVGKMPGSSLELVRIVIFQAPMLPEFHKSMQRREGLGPGAKPGVVSWVMSSLKSLFTGGQDKDGKSSRGQRGVVAIQCKVLDPAFFHICGESRDSVERFKQWLDDQITKDQFTDTISDEMLLSLAPADLKRIQDLQEKHDVKISLHEQDMTGAGGDDATTLNIEGLSRDVLVASREVQSILKRCREQESLNRQIDLTSNLVEWQHQASGQGQYRPFDPQDNFNLEQAKEGRRAYADVTIGGQTWRVHLPDGPATDRHGNQIKIKRIDRLGGGDANVPDYWDVMATNTQCQLFPLQQKTPEYDDVEQRFRATCRNKILKIERVQNPYLWRNYSIKKQHMEMKNGHQNNERRLFHGTSQPTIDHINHNGFNRSYAGKNAAAIGNGTYFAVNAQYSASNTYSVPDGRRQKYMYLCQVLTGDFTTGRPGMIVPPAKSNTSADLYDTVTDNPQAPSMFVVFNDIQAYPEYLITFH